MGAVYACSTIHVVLSLLISVVLNDDSYKSTGTYCIYKEYLCISVGRIHN